jgi:hypothetical protein
LFGEFIGVDFVMLIDGEIFKREKEEKESSIGNLFK